LLTVGVGLFFVESEKESGIKIISAESEQTGTRIVVHIEGEVKSPGVYDFDIGARVNDAVIAAGGESENADLAKLNLAQKLADGQKIYVPSVAEALEGNSSYGQVESGGLININTASASQLDKLPRVGPVTAQKIIAGRPYSSLEELLVKKSVGSSVFEQIQGQITY